MNVFEIVQKALREDADVAKAKAEFVESFTEVAMTLFNELQECKTLLSEIRDELRAARSARP